MLKIMFLLFSSIYLYSSEILPIPQKVDYDYDKAILGKKLFFDEILSSPKTISCASCHDLENGGDDGLETSIGIDGKKGQMNAPTVLNSAFNFAQFWNGRAANLKEQALEPIKNPIEMGNTVEKLVSTLQNSKYNKEFKKIYKDGVSGENIADALAEFEKTLITPNSRFDMFLRGDKDALTSYEKEGYELFKNKGCILCHHGVNIGGNHYSKFGNINTVSSKSLGRFEVTKREEDMCFFKVPSLRNIELTAPYLHDGREDSLKEVVKMMVEVQLGRTIDDSEVDKIVAFLKTLTGKLEVIE